MRKRIGEGQPTLYLCRQRTAFHVHTGQLLRSSFAEYRQGLSSVEKKHGLEDATVSRHTLLQSRSFPLAHAPLPTHSGHPMLSEAICYVQLHSVARVAVFPPLTAVLTLFAFGS